MHISEGVLSAPVLIGGGIASAAGVAIGLKSMKDKDIPKTAIISAALFVASLIHVPLGPTSVHLLLNGISGIILGWQVFPAVLIALFLQSILFQFGGITVLGVNTLNVALPAIIAHQFFKLYDFKNTRFFLGTTAFFSGALSVFITALMVALSLFFTNDSFLKIAKLTIVSHVPVMIIEGIISVFVIFSIKKIKPIILEELYKK